MVVQLYLLLHINMNYKKYVNNLKDQILERTRYFL